MPAPRSSKRVRFSLTLLPERGLHADLELRCGHARHVVDSYYLALDSEIEAGRESRTKVRRVLATSLRGVGQRLARAKAPSVVLFPYDFSDQYTGLLSLAVDARERVGIRRVYSLVQSWAIVVSTAWELPAKAWGALQPWKGDDDEAVVMSRVDLLDDIETSALVAERKQRSTR